MGIPLNEHFCVGPDARLHMWYGRRSQLDVDRGPCTSLSAFAFVEFSGANRDYRRQRAKEALVAAARKKLAYLERFGRPLLPFRRERREAYGYKEQSPSDHIKNLER